MGDVVYVNRNLFSWGDLIFLVSFPDAGNVQHRMFGFHSLDMGSQKRERPHQWAQNFAQAPIGLPKGKYTPPTPKIGWLAHANDADVRAQYDSFQSLLLQYAPDNVSYGDTRMNWLLQVDNAGAFASYAWYDVFLTGENASWEETAEGLKTENEFTCLRFVKNGGTLFDSSQER
jgi:hypothetical protein